MEEDFKVKKIKKKRIRGPKKDLTEEEKNELKAKY